MVAFASSSYYRQTMTWEPTIDDLCDNYDLDQEVCNQNKKKYRNFEMNLICKVEQEGGYFESENDNQEAVVSFIPSSTYSQ